ncbi:MAG TPA: 16S rRNA (guanine(527)-N(7))-methyltransferase RsmG [Syntrophales bacterium]|nr:16S rRNA (guanine(527)-N(7))-methyltransferase RsmG [Syntrophales bacterium]
MEKGNKEILLEAGLALGISLGEREMSLFASYLEDLLRWNSRMNLTALKSERDIIIKHFIDSLTLLPYIRNKSGRVLDIGSGAGFPGIPLKIAVDSLSVFLLEASRKKSSFLKNVVRALNLKETVVINSRAESMMEDSAYEGFFNIVTSRAAIKLPPLLRMGAFFLTPSGSLLIMKGKRTDKELSEARDVPQNLGLKYSESHDLTLPITDDFRRIFVFKKLAS